MARHPVCGDLSPKPALSFSASPELFVDGGSAGGGRNNVGFVKPQEPKFLREIKEKVTEKKTPRFEYLEGGIQGG